MSNDSTFSDAAGGQSKLLFQQLLALKTERIVFAESCTAGLVAALLGQNPGVSSFLCGSAVTYRESVKQAWLNVSEDTLSNHTAESLETTTEMAVGVLAKTNEATIAAAVTGHLGPGAPPDIDGKIFIAVARKSSHQEPSKISIASVEGCQLMAATRVERQFEAAQRVLSVCQKALQGEK